MARAMSSCRTTFIQNLLGPYAQQPDLAVNGVRGPEALRTFEHAPEKMATTVEVQDNNSLTNFFYSVQDTPGQPLPLSVSDATSWLGRLFTAVTLDLPAPRLHIRAVFL